MQRQSVSGPTPGTYSRRAFLRLSAGAAAAALLAACQPGPVTRTIAGAEARVVSAVGISQDADALLWITVAFVVAGLLYFGATYAQTYLTAWVGQRALADLRRRIFAHLQTLSIGFYSRNRSGVLISRLTNDVQALDTLVTDGIVTLFAATLTLLGTAAILVFLDPQLALITFLLRFLPLAALSRVTLPPWAEDWLRLVPGAVRRI